MNELLVKVASHLLSYGHTSHIQSLVSIVHRLLGIKYDSLTTGDDVSK